MTNRKQKRKPEPSPKPETPKVQHSPGGIKGRWLVNSLSFVLVILAVVVILISVGVSGYYYATVRDNLASRAATTSDTFRKYFTDTYDQFYTQAEATVTTFQDQDKFEQQFLDANGRILLSTSGLSGGGVASTEDASQALSGQKTAVFTGRDPLSGERVMSVTARRRAVYHLAAYRRTADLDDRRLLSAGVPAVPHAGCGVEQLFYPVDRRSGAQDQHHCQGDRGRTLRRAAAEDL